jgi:2-polyprenyl-3-methyl-5-hydroxy-6-metoxy-1,4-benzoquinol methylase/GT2 family glycosyltransferase
MLSITNNFKKYFFQKTNENLIRRTKLKIKKLVTKCIFKTELDVDYLKISLIMPVFNAVDYIEFALASIHAQQYPVLEVIIVDGASHDGTLEFIQNYIHSKPFGTNNSSIKLISEPDNGMYDAIAKGFAQATGDIFCYLNADDLLESGALQAIGKYFARHPKTSVVYHEDTVLVNGWKYPNARQPKYITTPDLLRGHILFQDGVFFRKEAYLKVGGVRRDLRLAGDFDLWLRLSRYYQFVRLPEHVSCFRIRAGQLSQAESAYREEMRQCITDFLNATPRWQRLYWQTLQTIKKITKRLAKLFQQDALFFPLTFKNDFPPPVLPEPVQAWIKPRSPIDGKTVERLLFTTPDTRFGDGELNYIYLDTRHDIAVTYPPIAADKLDALYRANYSAPSADIKQPVVAHSPYRKYFGGKKWEKIFLHFSLEIIGRVLRLTRRTTADEIQCVLSSSGIDTKQALRFFDVGCFEGGLLETLAASTPWQLFGLEPNFEAINIAQSKGYQVWQGHAEHAIEKVTKGLQFDVIHMGQAIEHIDDPVQVLRRLRLLLAPGGVLILSTPNLNSKQIAWFGPTWAHWHAPYHRFIFAKNGLVALAKQVGLSVKKFRTYSHFYWTAMTLCQNELGLMGSLSHNVTFDKSTLRKALRVVTWSWLLWDWRGQGDYSYIVLHEGEK